MADDSIHDDIREMRGMLSTLVAQGARTEQMYVGLNERLYNGGSGAIPVIFKAVGEAKAAGETNAAAIKAVAAEIKSQRMWASGLAVGVSLALQGAKVGLGKLFHF